jgi:alcohol dehydrogenase class IV
MVKPFQLAYPPLIRFGDGCRAELGAILRQTLRGQPPRPFLVTTRRLADSAELERLRNACGGTFAGVATGIPHDPPLETIDRLTAEIRAANANAVIAAGGGSILDAAKAAAALAPLHRPVHPFFAGQEPIPGPGLPLLALPTTAGSGAELTHNAVLTDPQAGTKKSLRSPHLLAAAALIDPELTWSAPPGLTAWSGLDALTQAIESYISRNAHAASRPHARAAVRHLCQALPAAVRNGADPAARNQVAAGSLLSAMAFSQSGLGAVHGLAHPLGIALGLPHGLTCAILLPHILRLNLPACQSDLAELAAELGLPPAADAFLEAIDRLAAELAVPTTFAAHGLTPAHFPKILADCRSASMNANPRPLTDADLADLLRRLARAA